MSIAQRRETLTEADKSPAETALAILKRIARDPRTAHNAALPVATELATDTSNGWESFTVAHLESALLLSRGSIGRALRLLARLGYLEERVTHRRAGHREARITYPPETPGAIR